MKLASGALRHILGTHLAALCRWQALELPSAVLTVVSPDWACRKGQVPHVSTVPHLDVTGMARAAAGWPRRGKPEPFLG